MVAFQNHKSLRNIGIRIIITGVFSITIAFVLYSFFGSSDSSSVALILYNIAIAVIILTVISLGGIGYGIYLVLFSESLKQDQQSYLGYASIILTNKTNWKIFVVSSIIYGILFGFLSQILIYHPDTHTDENNIAPNLYITLCCNYPGYVPMITIKLTEFFSILIIPINLMLTMIVSSLVGFNFVLNVYFIRIFRKQSRKKLPLISTSGVLCGLFIGCPTCAGSLFSAFVGFGTTIVISGLATFQTLFIVITIPILIGTPLIMIRKIMKTEKSNFS